MRHLLHKLPHVPVCMFMPMRVSQSTFNVVPVNYMDAPETA